MKTLAITLLLSLFCLAPAALADDPKLNTQLVVSGLDMPVGIFSAGDARLFIVLQRGRIVIWDGTQLLPTPFLNLQPLGIVSCCGERGLLGLAFHPKFSENGLFFVCYTDARGDITTVRYRTLEGDPNQADLTTAKTIITVAHRDFTNHYSGNLVFGPDGYLYMGTGDGGSGGDPLNNAQSLTRQLGKILRLDIDNGSPYAIPPTNPFADRPELVREIWAYGLRNPWRFTFDRKTGDLFIADVGQGNFEEVDFQPASSEGGENYGWRINEGFHCFPTLQTNCIHDFVQPILEYNHMAGDCSITGGYRYRGNQSFNMQGMYFYGDYCTGKIWGATQAADGTWSSKLLLTTGFSITSFGQDQNGELYVADHEGRIYKLVDESAQLPKRRRALR
ncbi:MAG TPA: PQQ-dependent sugar dehydrogenase [Thermoanaerobaculia bacterium]|nr:PQQ-dependent sugar dehydrogenase [Thermoanaerobaculia bacterium]